ncbi:hypothetical protein [Thalassovita sp.]|uniref:hypothetical protein n=1 Tax=Thalassovita sp. TaxID=1979401 RepID=UPI0029DE6660|nr:hypothetical protein [Thalassovita sp.]
MSEVDKYQSREILSETIEALERVQEFNVKSLVRKEDLGSNSFHDAVEPASKLKAILILLPVSALELFPNSELNQIKMATNAVYNAFEKILAFSVDEGDVANRRATLIDALWNLLQPTFSKLQPFVSYAVARTVDFGTLEQDARGSVQSIQDQTSRLMRELEEQKEAAQKILDDVRKTAAELI